MSPWVALVIAGLFETAWVLTLRMSEGWTRLKWSAATLVLMGVSFALLGRAIKAMPPATAYAVWVGIGAVGAALLTPLLFKETLAPRQIFCLLLIVAGIAGLKLTTPAAD